MQDKVRKFLTPEVFGHLCKHIDEIIGDEDLAEKTKLDIIHCNLWKIHEFMEGKDEII